VTTWHYENPTDRGPRRNGSKAQVRRLGYSWIKPSNTPCLRTLHATVVVAEEVPEVLDIDLFTRADPLHEKES
jgi:hypothetical protein